jgi:dihydrodipicolinate synthase/N-acetylneuraminate lyase
MKKAGHEAGATTVPVGSLHANAGDMKEAGHESSTTGRLLIGEDEHIVEGLKVGMHSVIQCLDILDPDLSIPCWDLQFEGILAIL